MHSSIHIPNKKQNKTISLEFDGLVYSENYEKS